MNFRKLVDKPAKNFPRLKLFVLETNENINEFILIKKKLYKLRLVFFIT